MTLLPLLLAIDAVAARPQWGGVGFVTQGFVVGDPSGIGDRLDVDGARGPALLLGGGGFVLLGGRMVLGGEGQLLEGLGGHTNNVDVAFSGGGGGLYLGYALDNDGRHLVFPEVGLVGTGGVAVLTTGADAAVPFLDGTLPAGSRTVQDVGGLSVAVGVRAFQLFWGEEERGIVLGGSLIGWLPLAGQDGAQTNLAPAGAAFLVHFGGGGASFR